METRQGIRVLLPIVAGLALAIAGAAGCSDKRSPVAPTGAEKTQTFSPVSAEEIRTSLQGDSQLGGEIAAIRAATAQFHDVNVAIAAGYANPAGQDCVQSAEGGMGIHSPNSALIANQAIDPLHPEVLLYLPKPDGGYRLIGVEYLQYVIVTDPVGSFSGPWTLPTPWPSNYLVSPIPELFGHPFLGPVPGHFPGMPWHREIHAWIWANNPDGIFEPWNPTVSCD